MNVFRRVALLCFVIGGTLLLSACHHAATAPKAGGFTITLGRCYSDLTGEEVPMSYCE